ncbi:MAG: hypothetical protein A2086_16950 [Spirochaetes bacterium GWD1_27_9]|nr:MAG: hypothetical protein A2Z98_18220 [Spirochaetes bacterium GWB1_27_13]OHD27030.1 MAG: hypothetical protein A2Y34_18350 [Spirochaetes bacterium GWC1_27_15]OHD29441.1 MAG: hypothetical protein A2086_16950 [Spirochaetes bacterium GWD1_27_9]
MDKVVRFSVSIQKELISEFDEIIDKKGFKNRSNALQEIIRKYVNDQSTDKKNTYILNIFYNHKMAKDISLIENSYPCSILSSINAHLDLNNSIKIVTLYCSEMMKIKIEEKYKITEGVEKITFYCI